MQNGIGLLLMAISAPLKNGKVAMNRFRAWRPYFPFNGQELFITISAFTPVIGLIIPYCSSGIPRLSMTDGLETANGIAIPARKPAPVA